MYVVASGNPFDGMVLTGPFESFEDAEDWTFANNNLDWYIVGLEIP